MEKSGSQAVTRIIRLMVESEVPANTEISAPPYNEIDGYRYANIFMRYTHENASNPPIDLAVAFGFDERGLMSARQYVTLDENQSVPQTIIPIQVSCTPSGEGSPVVTYIVRVPIMGPFIEVFINNRAPVSRKVNVWAYVVS